MPRLCYRHTRWSSSEHETLQTSAAMLADTSPGISSNICKTKQRILLMVVSDSLWPHMMRGDMVAICVVKVDSVVRNDNRNWPSVPVYYLLAIRADERLRSVTVPSPAVS